MKTKIRTLLVICVLGFVGLININATTDNKTAANAEVNIAKEELVTIETIKAEDLFIRTEEELTAIEADAEIEKYAEKQIFLIENKNEVSAFMNSAEATTASEADQEIEKYACKQISLQLIRSEK